jgi:hypothetical protein
VDDDGREPLERLVQQHDLGIAHQRPGDREHLLFAAGELGAAVVAPLLQPRKHLVDALERPALRCGDPGEDDVLLHRQAAEDPALLVHELHAGLRDSVTLASGDIDAVELHAAAAGRHDAHQALERRALAGAVPPEQRHHLVPLDAHGDVEQDVGVPVIAVQAVDLDQAHAAISP